MPEGDTIHKAAARVRSVIDGQVLLEVELPRLATAAPRPGVTVTGVEARGKWLLVNLDDGHTILTHLRMSGEWRVVPAGRGKPGGKRLVVWLRAERGAAACVDAPIAQLLDGPALARHPSLRALGPDLCLAEVDLDEVVRRAGQFAQRGQVISDVLLDQRIAAGIGNVYKSEVAFVHGLHPLTPNEQVDADLRRALFTTAHELLRKNLRTRHRTTVPGRREGSVWVYGRRGKPCRRCGTAIQQSRAGRDVRVTTWCPTCQPAPTHEAGAARL